MKQIRNFLLVLLAGIGGGFLLFFFFLHYYGPTGSYVAKNVLLSPKIWAELRYQDKNPKTGTLSRFIFQRAEFVYFNTSTKQFDRVVITPAKYAQLYELIANDTSLPSVTEALAGQFGQGVSAKIQIQVKTESTAEWQAASKLFQEVEILPQGDYYRVELRQDNASSSWVYFHHPGLYNTLLRLFVGEDS